MTSRQRLLAALDRRVPDRLPVTTHHLMPSCLAALGGLTEREFFDRFGLDAIRWTTPLLESTGDAGWRLEHEDVPDARYTTTRWRFVTPRGTLSTVLQDDGRTAWVRERLMKDTRDLAIVEAIALETRRCLTVLDEVGLPARPLRAGGHGASSPFFRQLLADATGREVLWSADEGAASARGAAAIAGASQGIGAPAAGEAETTRPDDTRRDWWERRWAEHERSVAAVQRLYRH